MLPLVAYDTLVRDRHAQLRGSASPPPRRPRVRTRVGLSLVRLGGRVGGIPVEVRPLPG